MVTGRVHDCVFIRCCKCGNNYLTLHDGGSHTELNIHTTLNDLDSISK